MTKRKRKNSRAQRRRVPCETHGHHIEIWCVHHGRWERLEDKPQAVIDRNH